MCEWVQHDFNKRIQKYSKRIRSCLSNLLLCCFFLSLYLLLYGHHYLSQEVLLWIIQSENANYFKTIKFHTPILLVIFKGNIFHFIAKYCGYNSFIILKIFQQSSISIKESKIFQCSLNILLKTMHGNQEDINFAIYVFLLDVKCGNL